MTVEAKKRVDERIALAMVEYFIQSVYGVSVGELHSKSRKKRIVRARFVAWCILNKFFNFPLLHIGNMFDKDHTTIMYGVEKILGIMCGKGQDILLIFSEFTENHTHDINALSTSCTQLVYEIKT